MKLLYFILFFTSVGYAQQFRLKIEGKTERETHLIDSIGYLKIHKDKKSIDAGISNFKENALKSGFLNLKNEAVLAINDSVFLAKFNLGKQIVCTHIYIGRNLDIKNRYFANEKDSLQLPIYEVEPFLNSTLKRLEKDGFSLAKVNLANIDLKNGCLVADLEIDLQEQRNLNEIVVKGFEKFPEGHLKQISRSYAKKTFNQDMVKKIKSDFDKLKFIKQIKYPEVLFTKDSTKVFVYAEPKNANTFDGFLGFGNDDSGKLQFNGLVDVNLINLMKSGEQISIYWKSDGNNQKTFHAEIELPYIFKSPLGIRAQLNIFKQDSIFQNAKTAFDLGYYFKSNSKVFLGYQSSESNDIQNTNTALLSDYKNQFVTLSYDFFDFWDDDKAEAKLFGDKTDLKFMIGLGSRKTSIESNSQFISEIVAKHDFELFPKNSINLRSQTSFLSSTNYVTNELFRFGGINSIRGFNENSLQGNFMSNILTEYRYLVASNLYVHSVLDYGYFQDKTTNTIGNLYGLGTGFGLLTKNGLLNLVYANGNFSNNEVKFSNSVVHISLKTSF